MSGKKDNYFLAERAKFQDPKLPNDELPGISSNSTTAAGVLISAILSRIVAPVIWLKNGGKENLNRKYRPVLTGAAHWKPWERAIWSISMIGAGLWITYVIISDIILFSPKPNVVYVERKYPMLVEHKEVEYPEPKKYPQPKEKEITFRPKTYGPGDESNQIQDLGKLISGDRSHELFNEISPTTAEARQTRNELNEANYKLEKIKIDNENREIRERIDNKNRESKNRIDTENRLAREQVDAENQQKKYETDEMNTSINSFNEDYLKRALLRAFGPTFAFFGFLFGFISFAERFEKP